MEKLEAENTAVEELAGREAPAKASSSAPGSRSRTSQQRLILAFAAVYLIWGSTYLAIKFAIETIPPFLMAGTRFIIAGSVLYGWMRRRGVPSPNRAQWRSATMVGALLFLGGNGALTWAELRVDTGLASLLVSTIPLWMVLLTHALHKAKNEGARLGRRVISGLVLGLVGVGMLIGPGDVLGHGGVYRPGAAVLLFGSLAWALGSLYSPKANLPRSTLLAASMEMICGGVLLFLLGLVTRESAALEFSAISTRSVLGFTYLITFGSLLGFTSYNWLLTHSTPARVSTYAYVNPVVAVFLGWAIAGEAVTLRMLAAAALVLVAVALIITHRPRASATPPSDSVRYSDGEEEPPPALPID